MADHAVHFDAAFRKLAHEIVRLRLDAGAWAGRESDDEFREGPYVGGYDATEGAFCFSFTDGSGLEVWFQLDHHEMEQVALGVLTSTDGRTPE